MQRILRRKLNRLEGVHNCSHRAGRIAVVDSMPVLPKVVRGCRADEGALGHS
jgi:hypothetical protein